FTEIGDVLRFHLKKKRVVEVLVTPAQLKKHVDAWLKATEGVAALSLPGEGDELDSLLKELVTEEAAAETEDPDRLVNESDSAGIRLANRILLDAYRRGASDIHIEPNGRDRPTTVRFRIDGDCVAYQDIPPVYRGPLTARLKIMAKLDIA